MSLEENKLITQRAAEAWNRGDHDAYLRLYDADCALHVSFGTLRGIEAVRQYYGQFAAAFPDARLSFADMLAEGDRLAIRFRVAGTHRGDFMGLPPTGRPFAISGITILRFAGGKCVERWSEADYLGLMRQLGALPTPAEASGTTATRV